MDTLRLLWLPKLFNHYFTTFPDIKSLLLIEINSSVISKLIKDFYKITFILDINNVKVIDTKSSINSLDISSLPIGYYYIVRSSFQYCSEIIELILRSREDNLLKYLYHDLLVLKLLKESYYRNDFNKLSFKEVHEYSKLFIRKIVDDYFVQSNLEFVSYSLDHPDLSYQKKLHILYYNKYHQIIKKLLEIR